MSTAPGDPGAKVRPFSLLGTPHCRLDSVRDDVNVGQEREDGEQEVASPNFVADEQATEIVYGNLYKYQVAALPKQRH